MTTTHPTTDLDPSGLDQVDPSTHPAREASHFREVLAANEAMMAARAHLDATVCAAREAGDSWTVIGLALGITKQAAAQRFSR